MYFHQPYFDKIIPVTNTFQKKVNKRKDPTPLKKKQQQRGILYDVIIVNILLNIGSFKIKDAKNTLTWMTINFLTLLYFL